MGGCRDADGGAGGVTAALTAPCSHHGLLLQLGLRRRLDREHRHLRALQLPHRPRQQAPGECVGGRAAKNPPPRVTWGCGGVALMGPPIPAQQLIRNGSEVRDPLVSYEATSPPCSPLQGKGWPGRGGGVAAGAPITASTLPLFPQTSWWWPCTTTSPPTTGTWGCRRARSCASWKSERAPRGSPCPHVPPPVSAPVLLVVPAAGGDTQVAVSLQERGVVEGTVAHHGPGGFDPLQLRGHGEQPGA